MQETSSDPKGLTINRTDRELIVTRLFDAPPRLVYKAWTTSELFLRWWAPKSMGMPLRSCDLDVRVGGGYRIEFGQESGQSWAFFGKYIEVVPDARLVWTNEEGGEDGPITTVTFEEVGGKTLLTFSELHPTPEGLEEGGGILPEQLDQLEALLAGMAG